MLHASYGVEGIQFVTPPGTSFLRMHAPDAHGDDLTGRTMITRAMTGGEAQYGVEIGTTGAKVRGVVRMAYDAGTAGVVEVQIGYSPVLDAVKDMTGYELAAYLKQVGPPPPDARMVDGYVAQGVALMLIMVLFNEGRLAARLGPDLLDEAIEGLKWVLPVVLALAFGDVMLGLAT